MNLGNTGRLLTIIALAALALQPARAATVTKALSGSITRAEPGNVFGLGVGEHLTGKITFDSSLLKGTGFEVITSDKDPALTLRTEIGPFSFDESDNLGSVLQFSFFDGNIFDIHFAALVSDDDFFRFEAGAPLFSLNDVTKGADGSERVVRVIDGSFEFLDVAAIPEPATLTLFGVALAALGIARRRRA